MKKHQLFILVLTLLYAVSAAAQFKPTIGFEELMISAEKDFNQVLEARKLAEDERFTSHNISSRRYFY